MTYCGNICSLCTYSVDIKFKNMRLCMPVHQHPELEQHCYHVRQYSTQLVRYCRLPVKIQMARRNAIVCDEQQRTATPI